MVHWQEVRWIWRMRQNLVTQLIQILKHWLCNLLKNWALSVNQCQLQALKFSVVLIDLLSILLRYNGFTRIQKLVLNQTVSRPPNNHQTLTMTFSGCKFGLGKCFGASSRSNRGAGHHQLSHKIHFLSLVTIWWRNGSLLVHRIREDHTSKWRFFFFICSQLMTYPLTEFSHLSNFLQMPNGYRTVDVEFFSNFSCSCKRISFNNTLNWLLSTSDGLPLHSSSRLLSPLQNFLNHHCTIRSVSIFWAKCIFDVVSCFPCFMTHFELK